MPNVIKLSIKLKDVKIVNRKEINLLNSKNGKKLRLNIPKL
jgi:hypothetical protein